MAELARDPFDYASDGIYADNIPVISFREDTTSYLLIPGKFPWNVVLANLLLIVPGCALLIALSAFADRTMMLFMIALSIATTGGYIGIVYWRIRFERARGAWLIYDKHQQTVSLPRQQKIFPFSQVSCLQYLSSSPFATPAYGIRSELRLITESESGRQMWPLLASAFYCGAFEDALNQLVSATPIPILRTTQSRLTGVVSTHPYVPRGVRAPDRLGLVLGVALLASIAAAMLAGAEATAWMASFGAGTGLAAGVILLSYGVFGRQKRVVIAALGAILIVGAVAVYICVVKQHG